MCFCAHANVRECIHSRYLRVCACQLFTLSHTQRTQTSQAFARDQSIFMEDIKVSDRDLVALTREHDSHGSRTRRRCRLCAVSVNQPPSYLHSSLEQASCGQTRTRVLLSYICMCISIYLYTSYRDSPEDPARSESTFRPCLPLARSPLGCGHKGAGRHQPRWPSSPQISKF